MLLPTILVFAAPLATQGGDVVPPLPPGDGLLQLEIPDLPRLLKAYPNAPLLQMIRDDAVRKSVGSLLEGADLEVGAAIERALERAGVPAEMAAAPLESMRGMLDQLQSMSLALSLTGSTETVAADLGGALESLLRVHAIKEKAAEYAEAHDGYPPSEVAELDVPDSWKMDPWGNPYQVAVDLESLAFDIVSLGADGAVGGNGFAADVTTAEPIESAATALVSRSIDLVATVEFTSQESARGAWGILTGAMESELGVRPEGRRDLQIGGIAARVCELPDLPGTGLAPWALAVNDGITVGVGRESLSRTVARVQTESGRMRSSEGVVRLAEHLPDTNGAVVATGWIELDRLDQVFLSVEHALESSGADKVQFMRLSGSGLFRAQLDGDRFVSEYAYNVSPDSSIARCAGAAPVPEKLWGFVPSESIGVYASSIDGRAIYDEIMRNITEVHGERPKALERLESEHGFSLENDLIGNLGGGAAAYLLPISGVITIPGIAVVVELRDAEAFQRGLDAVLTILEQQSDGAFTVRYRPYRDQPMWSFTFGGEGGFSGPFQVSPTLTIVQDHLLISLTSTRAKKEVKRLLEGEVQERHRLFSVRGAPPADAGTITFMDWPSLVDGTYEGARAALTMFGGMMEEMPVDAESLPPSTTFTRFFEPSVSWTRTVGEDVRLTRSESSFGPETLLGLAGGVGAIVLAVRDLQTASSRMSTTEVEVVRSEQVQVDEQTRAAIEESQAAMEWLATRLEVYRIENGSYPHELAVLTRPRQGYPKGYLDGGAMPNDGWGRALGYRAQPDGKGFVLWSNGANGDDEGGRGDDIVLR